MAKKASAKGSAAAGNVRTFRVIYEEAPGRPILPVNGAYGGTSTDGSVIANLYLEAATIPSAIDFAVGPDGSVNLGEEQMVVRQANLTRSVVATLMLSAESAERIGQFLVDKAKAAKISKPPSRKAVKS